MSDELTRSASPTGLCRLDELASLDIIGEDAQTFLQTQLTSDVHALKVGNAQYTAYCSPKGRMLANGYLARISEHHYRWIVDQSIFERLVKRLSMFILRSKVKLQTLDAHCYGMLPAIVDAYDNIFFSKSLPISAAPAESLQLIAGTSDCITLRLPRDRTLLINTAPQPSDQVQERARIDWDIASIAADEVLVTDATFEELIPQMIEWDRLGGVSFKKGCYPGQEIVARSHYLGKMKRRLFRATFKGAAPLQGTSILLEEDSGQTAGMVVRTASTPEGGVLLAVLSTDLVKSNTRLHLADEAKTPLDTLTPRFPTEPANPV